MLFVILGFFVRLLSEVEALGRLAVGAAGNAGRSGCPEVGVFCASVCPDVGVFCVFSALFLRCSRRGVSREDMMRICGGTAREADDLREVVVSKPPVNTMSIKKAR
jgi:hypothetical protein